VNTSYKRLMVIFAMSALKHHGRICHRAPYHFAKGWIWYTIVGHVLRPHFVVDIAHNHASEFKISGSFVPNSIFENPKKSDFQP
jgi:hypothetical protein